MNAPIKNTDTLLDQTPSLSQVREGITGVPDVPDGEDTTTTVNKRPLLPKVEQSAVF